MSYRGKLKRYLLILERLARPASFAELEEHLNDRDINLSPRTLQRDIEELRHELDIKVVYDRAANLYRIDPRGDQATVAHLLERYRLMELMGVAGRTGKGHAARIVIEGQGRLAGSQHVAALLGAIHDRRVVELTQRVSQDERTKAFRLQPHLLKEYRGRWYVLGLSEKHPGPLAMGLDRVEAVVITGRRFKRTPKDVADLYAHVIGVDVSPGKAVRVLLRVDPLLAEHLKSLPLHPSQQVAKEDKSGVTLSLFVVPNAELLRTIMGWGASVQVLEPKALAKAIRQAHKEAAGRYK